MKPALLLLLAAMPALAATRVLVTVVEQRSGRPVTGLQAGDFTVFDDRAPRRVEAAEFSGGLIDVVLLIDTSLLGPAVQPVAQNLIGQLREKEQMAVVSFDSTATLIQDFTSSRELLARAVAGVKFGNAPRVVDALYAVLDGGFQGSSFRRAILLLTAGFEGPSRIEEREVFRLARRNQASIFPVYLGGGARSLFESLARQTGGACFNLRDLKRASAEAPGARIFEVLRAHYTLTLSGNLALSERMKIDVKRPEKTFVSALTLE
jgi:VWFA-related protein